jgi:hypothetical protein
LGATRWIDELFTVRPMRRRDPLILASGCAVAALSLLAAGCGGGSSPKIASVASSTTAATTTTAAGGSAPGGELAEYAHCMRSQGFNFPEAAAFESPAGIRAAKGQMAQFAANEATSTTFAAAQRACAKYYGPTATPPHVSSEELQKLLAVSHCMRAHGLAGFPDPNPTTGEIATPASIDKNSPQAIAALRACRSLGQAAGLGAPNTGP